MLDFRQGITLSVEVKHGPHSPLGYREREPRVWGAASRPGLIALVYVASVVSCACHSGRSRQFSADRADSGMEVEPSMVDADRPELDGATVADACGDACAPPSTQGVARDAAADVGSCDASADCQQRPVCDQDERACAAGCPRDEDGDGTMPSACGGDDCDDTSAERNTGLEEVCDGLDNDCDGMADDGLPDCAQDCDGVWGGEARLDPCGHCDDDPSNDCPEIASSGLVAEWRFDRHDGMTLAPTRGTCGSLCEATLWGFRDLSARDLDISSGWATAAETVTGGALTLDGVKDYVEIPDRDQLIHGWSALSVELVVRFHHFVTDQVLFTSGRIIPNMYAEGSSFVFKVEAAGALFAGFYQTTRGCWAPPCRAVNGGQLLQIRTWYHVAVVFNAGVPALYIDGVAVPHRGDAQGTVAMLANPTAPHRIGVHSASGGEPQEGWLDGDLAVVRVYERPLTPQEVAANAAAELPHKIQP